MSASYEFCASEDSPKEIDKFPVFLIGGATKDKEIFKGTATCFFISETIAMTCAHAAEQMLNK
jgi:hypothetical protein